MAGKEMQLGIYGHQVRENIAGHRTKRGMSYAEMSRRLKVAGRPIPSLGLRRLEAGERRVDVDDLVVIARVLDVSLVALLQDTLASDEYQAGYRAGLAAAAEAIDAVSR